MAPSCPTSLSSSVSTSFCNKNKTNTSFFFIEFPQLTLLYPHFIRYNCSFIQIFNQAITFSSSSHVDVTKTAYLSSNDYQNGDKRWIKLFSAWDGCWCQTGMSITETTDPLRFFHITISKVYRDWFEEQEISSEQQISGRKYLADSRGQRRMGFKLMGRQQ